MKKTALIPSIISSLRIAVLPLFFTQFSSNSTAWCLLLIAFSALTDFLDGYLSRKINSATRFGAYFDATTDFILVFGIYVIFAVNGYYPVWLLLLIAASFVQFLATSAFAKKIYDPVGRYMGSALYIGIILTLLSPTEPVFVFVQVAYIVFFSASLASRLRSLTKKKQLSNPNLI
jgi:phosphatidylglycerophosphate synthase